jgi:hypothetical protein
VRMPQGYTPPPPAPVPRVWPKVRRQLLIVGALFTAALFSGVLRSGRGWLAIALAWALVGILGNHRAQRRAGRVVVEWVAVAMLAVIIVNAAPSQVRAPTLKAPVKVEAAQTDQLEVIRRQVTELWQRAATGFGQATTPPTKKGDR